MPLLGQAALAMWWSVANEHLAEFHEWHSREHLPERIAVPGFQRGSRWQQEGGGEIFVMYEVASSEILASDAYLERLNNPTRWSTTMMALHRGMVRSQCRVVSSSGRGVATFITTIRLSPAAGGERALEEYLIGVLAELPGRPGITGAHLLRTETPAVPPTKEQQMRGGDTTADWIVLVSGHERTALEDVTSDLLDQAALLQNGASAVRHDDPFRLVHALIPADV